MDSGNTDNTVDYCFAVLIPHHISICLLVSPNKIIFTESQDVHIIFRLLDLFLDGMMLLIMFDQVLYNLRIVLANSNFRTRFSTSF